MSDLNHTGSTGEEEKRNVTGDTGSVSSDPNTVPDAGAAPDQGNVPDAGAAPMQGNVPDAGAASDQGTAPDDGTYRWVNPKLQGNQTGQSGQDGKSPWNSSTGENYWHYSNGSAARNDHDSTSGNQPYGGANSNYQHGSANSNYQHSGANSNYQHGGANSNYQHGGADGNYQYGGSDGNYQYGGPNRNYEYGGANGNRQYGGAFGGGGYGNGGSVQNRKRPEKRKRAGSRHRGKGAKVLSVIVMALIFGAVAGLVMYGVYSVANTIRPVGGDTAAASSEDSSQESSGTDHASGEESIVSSASEENGTVGTDSIDTTQQDLENSSASNGGTMTVAEVTAACMPSVVTIATVSVQEMQSFFGGMEQYQVAGAGTGVIIGSNDSELLIATNNHVVSGAEQLTVGFVDESAITAEVKGSDTDSDLAVVAVKLEDIPDATKDAIRIADIGDSDALELGEQVVVIGNALGYGQSVTSGYVSALDRTLELTDGTNVFTSEGLIQTDAAINSGNSGGALLNMQGELVGINEAKSSYSSSGATVDNVGYAIPMEKAKPILEELMNSQTRELVDEDERGYLGASLADVTSDYAQLYQMPIGVCITQVITGGPADTCGLQRGDVITGIDDTTVTTYDELSSCLDHYAAGETVKITYQRYTRSGYEEQQTEATLVSEDEITRLKNENGG